MRNSLGLSQKRGKKAQKQGCSMLKTTQSVAIISVTAAALLLASYATAPTNPA